MVIDVIFLLIIIASFYSGFKQGIIYAVLSFLGIFVGVIAALNFSTFAGIWLVKNFNLPEIVIPTLSFVVVLIVVIAAIKFVAFLAKKILQTISLNFVNKISGGLLYAVLASFIFSVLFSFIDQYGFLTEAVKAESQVYPYVSTFGPIIFKNVSDLIPVFNDIYKDTNEIFKNAASSL
ncbi:MAG: membrane protein required for colicin V production [Planctomycetota bacterium]|jgi:membrane protein required for colicin V production